VLIIRLDRIGDFILWSHAANDLAAHYRAKGDTVVLIANEVCAPWARSMNLADEVWGVEPRRFIVDLLYRRRWLGTVRAAGFATVVHPTYSRTFLEGDALVRASRAPIRIGSRGDASHIGASLKSWSDRWYTSLIAASPGTRMELLRNAEFMRGLGIRSEPEMSFIPRSPHVRTTALPSSYAVLFPGATWEGRMWPTQSFVAIAQRLIERGFHIVVAGGESERSLVAPMLAALGSRAIDLVGKTALPDLTEVLRGARIVITNETSAAHISAAVGTSVVCILGGGHFGRFLPYPSSIRHAPERPLPKIVTLNLPCFGCGWHCQFPRDRGEAVKCIRDVTVEQVWAAVVDVVGPLPAA
jgi:ADP-heptose:LPS heptosyltransferase